MAAAKLRLAAAVLGLLLGPGGAVRLHAAAAPALAQSPGDAVSARLPARRPAASLRALPGRPGVFKVVIGTVKAEQEKCVGVGQRVNCSRTAANPGQRLNFADPNPHTFNVSVQDWADGTSSVCARQLGAGDGDYLLELVIGCKMALPPPKSTLMGAARGPHVTNLKGEEFDVLQSGLQNFLEIPRGAREVDRKLSVQARLQPVACDPLKFATLGIDKLKISGKLLRKVESVELEVLPGELAGSEARLQLSVDGNETTLISLQKKVPGLVHVTRYQRPAAAAPWQPADVFVFDFFLGTVNASVGLARTLQPAISTLWFRATGLSSLGAHVGGVLGGEDDHTWMATTAEYCEP